MSPRDDPRPACPQPGDDGSPAAARTSRSRSLGGGRPSRRHAGAGAAQPVPRPVVATARLPSRGVGRGARSARRRAHRGDARHRPPADRRRRAAATPAVPTGPRRRARPSPRRGAGTAGRRPGAGAGLRRAAPRRATTLGWAAASSARRALPQCRSGGHGPRLPQQAGPRPGPAARRVGQDVPGRHDHRRGMARPATRRQPVHRRGRASLSRRLRTSDTGRRRSVVAPDGIPRGARAAATAAAHVPRRARTRAVRRAGRSAARSRDARTRAPAARVRQRRAVTRRPQPLLARTRRSWSTHRSTDRSSTMASSPACGHSRGRRRRRSSRFAIARWIRPRSTRSRPRPNGRWHFWSRRPPGAKSGRPRPSSLRRAAEQLERVGDELGSRLRALQLLDPEAEEQRVLGGDAGGDRAELRGPAPSRAALSPLPSGGPSTCQAPRSSSKPSASTTPPVVVSRTSSRMAPTPPVFGSVT